MDSMFATIRNNSAKNPIQKDLKRLNMFQIAYSLEKSTY